MLPDQSKSDILFRRELDCELLLYKMCSGYHAGAVFIFAHQSHREHLNYGLHVKYVITY